MATEIPISSLNASDANSTNQIQGVIRLLWPFSQSAQTLALLLSDADFKAQTQHGQVRVQFAGPAARVVAASGVAITDTLRISLSGSRWIEDTNVRTPGKSVKGELSFRNRLDMHIIGSTSEARHILVDQEDGVLPASVAVTPVKQMLAIHSDILAVKAPTARHSPAVFRPSAPASPFSEDFVDELLNDEGPRKRPRVSLGQVRDWRYSRRASDASDHDDDVQAKPEAPVLAATSSDQTITETHANQGAFLMLPPALPALRLPQDVPLDTSQADRPLTPTLQPVSAASLPLPSPFPDGAIQYNFPTASPIASKSPILSAQSDAMHIRQVADIVAVTNDLATIPTSPQNLLPPPTPTRTVPKAVYASLFGTPPNQAPEESLQGESRSQHRRQPTDFEIAETQFTQSTPDDQDSNIDSTSQKESSRQASAELDNEILSTNKVSEPAMTPRRQDMAHVELEDGVPYVMSKWSNPRKSRDSAAKSNRQCEQDILEVLSECSDSGKSISKSHEEGDQDATEVPAAAKKQSDSGPVVGGTQRDFTNEMEVPDVLSKWSNPRRAKGDATVKVIQGERDVPDVMRKWSNPRKSLPKQATAPVQRPIRSAEPVDQKQPDRVHDQGSRKPSKQPLVEVDELIAPATTKPPPANGQISMPAAKQPSKEIKPIPDYDQRGLYTDYAYFVRLGSLSKYLNVVNEQGTSAKRIDVLAVITEGLKPPKKLEAGRRDWFITMEVADLSTSEYIRVDLFRPYRPSLPRAQKGDVILLRAFSVQSHDRRPYLKSNDESAWCVWRYAEYNALEQHDEVSNIVKEEIRGPPVEYGDDERAEALQLHQWFMTSPADQKDRSEQV